MGKILSLDNKVDFTVSGIVHIPDNTDFKADFYLSFKAYDSFNFSLAELETNWKGKNFHAYILLGKGSSSHLLEKKISGFLKKHNPERNEKLTLQKLSQVHLYKPDGTGDAVRYVYVFSIIAIFILLIACVNFMNLATARSEKRAKEVGLRKTIGTKRAQLIKQFLTESILFAFFSFAISLVIVELLLPLFNTLSGKQFVLDFSNLNILLGLTGVVLLTGILSGSYPALFLSSFTPIKIIKGTFFSLAKGSLLRNGLVIFQFTLSITLIICTAIVYSQLKYIQNKDLGLDKENLVYILMEGDSKKYLVMRTKPGDPAEMINHFRQVWNGINPGFAFDYHFFDETYDRLYKNEKQLGRILFYFAFLAIFISCMGLFGLASFMAERRTKEIGIRKTLGASVPGITIMLSKKFTSLVVLSNVIGWPIAYYAMKSWLGAFAYRTGIGINVFIWGGILALSIAWLTISYQSIKAALANPVEALRYE